MQHHQRDNGNSQIHPLIGYTRLSNVEQDSSLRRVAFDLTIQQTSEGEFDEQGLSLWSIFSL